MRWATRPGLHVDRLASAWLISRHVDPEAEFVYFNDLNDIPCDVTPFDMFGCELGHRGDDVTFETILRHYELIDPVLARIGEIVHEADVGDYRFDAPESAGFELLVRATQHGAVDDEELRALWSSLFDSIERFLRCQILGQLP